jgi:hypothetical protein
LIAYGCGTTTVIKRKERQAVEELLSRLFKGFPDFKVDIDKTHHSEFMLDI